MVLASIDVTTTPPSGSTPLLALLEGVDRLDFERLDGLLVVASLFLCIVVSVSFIYPWHRATTLDIPHKPYI